MTEFERLLQNLMNKHPKVPINTLQGLMQYWINHQPVGGFLTAILSNDLMESIGRADEYNYPAIQDICVFIHQEMPSICHGSLDRIEEWLSQDENNARRSSHKKI